MCGYEVSCSQIDDNLTINILLPPMGLFAFCSILFHGTLMPIWFENWLGLSISFLTGNIYMTPRNPKRRGGGKLRKLRLMLYLCYWVMPLQFVSLERKLLKWRRPGKRFERVTGIHPADRNILFRGIWLRMARSGIASCLIVGSYYLTVDSLLQRGIKLT